MTEAAEEKCSEETPSVEHQIMVLVSCFHELLASDNPSEAAIANSVWIADCLARSIKCHSDAAFEAHKDSPTAKMILNFMLMIADLSEDAQA